MTYHFPRTIFTNRNTIPQQLLHIASEGWEVFKVCICYPINYKRMAEELIDLVHSVETLLRMLAEREKVPVGMIKDCVVKKNRDRGYYE